MGERNESAQLRVFGGAVGSHTDMRSPMLSGAGSLLKVVEYLFDHGSDNPEDKVTRTHFSLAVASLRKNEQLLKSGGVKCAFWKIAKRKPRR